MSHLNMAQIQELKDVMEEGFNDLVLTYLQDSDNKFKALKKAINANDCHQVAEVAHSLKGSSANICAEALSALFKKVEDAGRAQELDSVPYTFEKIQEEFTLVKAELQQLK
jgi:HPt (histidine-containing phosphotransfer) domain-containing protein